jgi:hypothetical protein
LVGLKGGCRPSQDDCKSRWKAGLFSTSDPDNRRFTGKTSGV